MKTKIYTLSLLGCLLLTMGACLSDGKEDYLDEYGDMLEEEKETETESDKLVSLLNCIKAKGMPKQVIICSENAVRAYSEIKKLEIKDKKLFIENCLCEFNNDEQVNFIY